MIVDEMTEETIVDEMIAETIAAAEEEEEDVVSAMRFRR